MRNPLMTKIRCILLLLLLLHVWTVRVLSGTGGNAVAPDRNGQTVRLLVKLGADVNAQHTTVGTPLHLAAGEGQVETVRLPVEMGTDVHARAEGGVTPSHVAASEGHMETVKVLMEIGGSILAHDVEMHTPIHYAETKGHVAIASFMKNNARCKRRSKFTKAPVVDPVSQAAAEAAAAAMAVLLIAEEEDYKQCVSFKQGISNKARKHRNRRKANADELTTGSKGHDEAASSSVASSSGRKDNACETYGMEREAACHSNPDGEMDAQGGEENAVPVFNNGGQGHNNASERSVSRNTQWVEAGSVESEACTSNVEQPTATQAELRQQKERDRKGKQRQRKRATAQATLEEALARVDTAGESLDTLNALDAAIVSAKRILEHGDASCSAAAPMVSSFAMFAMFAITDLPELLRQAVEKSLNLRRELHAMAEAASVDLSEEGLVRLAVAESSAHVQEQQQSSI